MGTVSDFIPWCDSAGDEVRIGRQRFREVGSWLALIGRVDWNGSLRPVSHFNGISTGSPSLWSISPNKTDEVCR
jgi:hypothetical protein